MSRSDTVQNISSIRLACCFFVVLLAAGIQWFVVGNTEVFHPIRADAAKYVAYAYNLKHHRVFSHTHDWEAENTGAAPAPDKLTLPGYPAFLTLWLGNEPKPDYASVVTRVTHAQMALGIGTCILTLLLALQLLPFRWAIATGLLTAISPHLATISTYLLTESLFTLLFVGSLSALVIACKPGARWPIFLLAGALLAIASLVRPQLTLLPFLLLGICMTSRRLRMRWRPLLLGIMVFVAILAPWFIRNARTTDSGPNLTVMSLYHGSFPEMMYQGDPRTYGAPYLFDPDADAHSSSLAATLHYIGEEFRKAPVRMTHWYLLGKPEFFLSWNIIAGGGDVFIYPVARSPYLQSPPFKAMRALSFSLHWPVTLLALVGMLLAFWRPSLLSDDATRQTQLRLLATVLATMLIMHMLGAPFPRYGIPFRPLIYLLGVATLCGLKTEFTRRNRSAVNASHHPPAPPTPT